MKPSFQAATIDYLSSLSEKDLQAKVVEPLLRSLGYKHVRDTSGPNEAGKDLVAVRYEFGRTKLYAIQLKKIKFSGKSGSQRSLYRISDQLAQKMMEPAIDPTTNVRRQPDRGLFITPFRVQRNALETALRKVRDLEHRDVTIIDGSILADQVLEHLSELLLTESAELQYRYLIAQASDRIRESSAFGLGEELSLDSVFVDVGFSYGLGHLRNISKRRRDLPGPQVLEVDKTATDKLTTQWKHWSRSKPRIWRPPRRQPKARGTTRFAEIDLDPVLKGVQRKTTAIIAELRGATYRKGDLLNQAIKKGIELRHRLRQLNNIPELVKFWPVLDLSPSGRIDSVIARMSIRELLFINHPVFLTGGPGAGKTTILRRLCQLTARESADHVPILLYLSRLKGTSEGALIEGCLSELRSVGYRLSPSRLKTGLEDGRYRVLLDGLDETGSRGQKVMKSIIGFSARFRRCPLIASCRDSYPYPDWDRAIHLKVPHFDDDLVATFVARWFDSQPTAASGVNTWLRENPQMNDTVRAPVMLALLCALYHADADLPTSEVELYEGRFELLLGKWEKAKGTTPLPPQPRKRHFHFLMALALSVHSGERRSARPEDVEKIALGFFSRKYHGRVAGLVQDCVQRGLLFREDDGGISFGHLTYQEFLVGRRLALDSPSSLLFKKLKSPWWSKSLQFYAAIMGDISHFLGEGLRRATKRKDIPSLEVLLFLTSFAPLTAGDIVGKAREVLIAADKMRSDAW